MSNRLADATSPYLQQHKDNPVHWRPWDEAALAEARGADKPILLSVGYAACHWCHVMAHESFENPEIAALMNRDFVNIKVDREERPDLDAIYQHALALLGEQGGWPLTMFLTPEGRPFWGGTYFPPEPRHGRPGMPQVLESLARVWRDERGKVASNIEALGDALKKLGEPEPGLDIPLRFGHLAAQRAADAFDTINGGLGLSPKFPNAPILDFLLRTGLLRDDPSLTEPVLHTLNRVCQGGIYDHLGGGFARYAVDAHWLVPHFEKMLYDNAQLLDLLVQAYAVTGDPLYAERARETVLWLEREMLLPEGGFASSLDADSEGEEGRFYVWDADEIDRVLGDAAPAFRLAYGVRRSGNWEGKNVLNRLHARGVPEGDEAARLAESRAKLMEARAGRVRPGRDDKALADWNGMTIAALARAALAFDEPGWLERAKAAFAFVAGTMTTDDGRLVHSYRDGRRLRVAFVDDYAQMLNAAVALFEATGSPAYLDRAQLWAEALDRRHHDGERGGYFTAADDAADVIVRAKSAQDGPVPSGNGALVGVFARLHALTGRDGYRGRAEEIVRVFAGDTQSTPIAYAALLAGNQTLKRPVQVALIGEPGDAAFEELRAAAFKAPAPDRVILAIPPGTALPDDHPAAGKTAVNGRATAYVCVGPVCRAPVTDADSLRRELDPSTWRAALG